MGNNNTYVVFFVSLPESPAQAIPTNLRLATSLRSSHDGICVNPIDIYLIRYIIEDMNGKQVIKRLEAQGFVLLRTVGSHHILSRASLRVTVPVHGATELKTGTLKSIEKQSGVKLT